MPLQCVRKPTQKCPDGLLPCIGLKHGFQTAKCTGVAPKQSESPLRWNILPECIFCKFLCFPTNEHHANGVEPFNCFKQIVGRKCSARIVFTCGVCAYPQIGGPLLPAQCQSGLAQCIARLLAKGCGSHNQKESRIRPFNMGCVALHYAGARKTIAVFALCHTRIVARMCSTLVCSEHGYIVQQKTLF